MLTISDQARLRVTYRDIDTPSYAFPKAVTMDERCWIMPPRLRSRKNNWRSEELEPKLNFSMTIQNNRILPTGFVADQQVGPVGYTVRMTATIPEDINGAPGHSRTFLGVIINKEAGFVLIPQAIVPSSLCCLRAIFEDSVDLPAAKVFESALGYAVAQYDPELIKGETHAANLSQNELQTHDTTTIYGLNRELGSPCTAKATVRNIEPLPVSCHWPDFHHPVHAEVLYFEESSNCSFGVLLNDAGEMEGLWVPFNLRYDITYFGMSFGTLRPDLELLQQGSLPKEPKLLDALLNQVSKHEVTAFGVPECR